MVLEFEYVVGGELNRYNENDGWPIFIDEFVNFLKK
jgi:hypothetical protein